jgi:hypothetical protein
MWGWYSLKYDDREGLFFGKKVDKRRKRKYGVF